ncbi:hypothetical protein BMF35_a1112 [Aurantiacibacter gangjinensis]|nr:hypothetical protein BMF35_a1112 [Aurantiacibacter gangjinensis]
MLGVWGDELSCQGLSDGRLEITPQRVEFHESVGEIQVASTQGEWTEFALAMSGEGETWESTERFRVTDEGIERETGGTVRPRCAEEYQ